MNFFSAPANVKTTPGVVTIKDYLEGNGVAKLTPEQVIAKARTRLMMTKPFWGMLIASCDIYFLDHPKMQTAWTNGFTIGFNPNFFEKLTIEELNFILAHEVWHMANLHIPRLGAKDPQVWNVASDHWINLTLEEEAIADPKSMQVPDMKRVFPNEPDAGLCMDHKYKDQGADQIYADIVKSMSKDPKNGNKQQGQSGQQGQQQGGIGGDLDYEGYQQQSGSQEQKAKDLAEQWKGRMASAADAAKKAGKLPGNLARQVEKLLQPEVDYLSLLASFISFHASDYEFTAPDRRFTEFDYIVPDMVGEKLECAVTIDTSGSISDKMIEKFISETYGLINSFDFVSGTLIGHDHSVHDWHEFTTQEPPPTKLKGGGGTNFHVVFDECKAKEYKPDVMIWFTDLYAEYPPKPDFPVVFVIVNSNQKPPEWAADHIYMTIPHH